MSGLRTSVGHVWHLGVKELRSLWRDRLLLFVVWAFSGALYTAAKAAPDRLHRAAIAVVDEDRSPLSQRIVGAFYPPTFMPPTVIGLRDMDAGMDAGRFTFVLDIPPDFQSDVLAGKRPAIQLNVDATQMSQAFLGAGTSRASRSPKSASSWPAIARTPPPSWTWPCATASTRAWTTPGSWA